MRVRAGLVARLACPTGAHRPSMTQHLRVVLPDGPRNGNLEYASGLLLAAEGRRRDAGGRTPAGNGAGGRSRQRHRPRPQTTHRTSSLGAWLRHTWCVDLPGADLDRLRDTTPR